MRILGSIKDEFKKLFWSTLSQEEIKNEIGLTHGEYQDLLREVKVEFGLPTSFRRNPTRWNKYNKDFYYIIYYFEDDFKIIKYIPTLESAKYELSFLLRDNSEYLGGEYKIEKASDDNIKRLIYKEYFVNGNNWEKCIDKLKIPYHKFYDLLKELKMEYKKSDSNINKLISKDKSLFLVTRKVNNKDTVFGKYDSLEVAVCIRDYLESINWDKKLFEMNEDKILKEFGSI